MRTNNELIRRRREQIVAMLAEKERMSVNDLAEAFGVSMPTMRRDLIQLESEGIIAREYGSARIRTIATPSDLTPAQVSARDAIARTAASFVSDEETIFINTSSTALSMIGYITAENVTIVTNNGRALEMPLNATMTVILTGGEIRIPKWAMTGDFALASIVRARATKCFMGCSGITAQAGIMTATSQEAPVNTAMIDHADHVFVLADFSKVGTEASFVYGQADQIDVLITDAAANARELDRLRAHGVDDVLIADA